MAKNSNHSRKKVKNPGNLHHRSGVGENEASADARSRLLADVVLNSKDAVTVQDPEGRIMAWNKGAEKMYGYSEAEALGMNISSLIPADRQKELFDLIEQVKAGKETGSLQTRRIRRDGISIDVWLTVTGLVDAEGKLTGLATIERDVTEHNRLLEEVETSFALAEEFTNDIHSLVAERTASLIALNIADRVTNPAVVIGMLCRKLLSKPHIGDSDRTSLMIIQEESEKLQNIVKEFSALIEMKQTGFTYEDINVVIKEAVALIRKEAEKKNIKLTISLSDTPLMINMHRNVLRTAIYYVYRNSLEATPGGGRIITYTKENSDSVMVVISDTGSGIAAENVSRIFDNFFTTKSNGAGMGLPFVKHIVNEHLGDIRIESRRNGGTKCTMRFPLRWLKMSEGKLTWERPMLPMERKEGYPLQISDKRQEGGSGPNNK